VPLSFVVNNLILPLSRENPEITMARTVFITGANSGVGLATVKVFAREGWNVVATARDPASATHLQEFAHSHEDNILIVVLDMTKPSTYQQALDAAINKFGKVDVLVNNAGYGQFGPLESLEMEDYRRQFDVNVFGQ
jgi:NAD(P)-dependent dehydrogenase (short-subunit alcohol dehydrogenase family)